MLASRDRFTQNQDAFFGVGNHSVFYGMSTFLATIIFLLFTRFLWATTGALCRIYDNFIIIFNKLFYLFGVFKTFVLAKCEDYLGLA